MTNPRRNIRHWRALAGTVLLAALATVAAMLAPGAPAALADDQTATSTTAVPPPGQLVAIQARSAALVRQRVASLEAAIRAVGRESYLGTDAATLEAAMQADITGLQALEAKIAADTTVQQAASDQALIWTQFRVYRLVLPVARLVATTGYIVNVVLPALNQELAEAQARVSSSGQGALGPLVAQVQAELQVAANATNGLSAELLGYTAAQWDANPGLLVPAQTSVRTALQAISLARRDLGVLDRYLHRYPPSTTTTTITSTTTTTTAPTTTTTVAGVGCSAPISGAALARTGWVASTNAPSSSSDVPANALDGNLATRFSTNEPQRPGLYLMVDLGTPQSFDELEMDVPNSPHDFARGYDVEVYNGTNWVVVASCSGTGTPEVVSFPAQTAQYVAVVLTASTNWWWSVDELYLYSAGPAPATTTTSTTVPASTTTTVPAPPPPPGRHPHPRLRLCHFKIGVLAPWSLVLKGHGAFMVVAFPCRLLPVRGVRVRVSVDVRGHLRFDWDDHFKLGGPMRGRLVELEVAGHQWSRWNGTVYRVR